MTKAQIAERDEAIAELRKRLKPGDRIYAIVRHVSRSGMQRSISLTIARKGEIESLDFWASRALDLRIDRKNGGIKIDGCGMDMGFQLVYMLGSALWPHGTSKPHGRRNGEPDSTGGYALKHVWL